MKTQTRSPRVVQLGPRSRYRRLSFIGPIVDRWLAWLRGEGYSESTICNYLKAAAPLACWLQKRGRDKLNEGDLCAAYEHFRRRRADAAATCRALGRFLVQHGLIRAKRPEPLSPSEREIQSFASH